MPTTNTTALEALGTFLKALDAAHYSLSADAHLALADLRREFYSLESSAPSAAEPVALTGEREAELWMAGFRAAETRRAGNLDENTQVVTVQAHNNALRRLMSSLRQPVKPSEITRPYGMCSITGPAEDVGFMLRHLPDVEAGSPAPAPSAASEREALADERKAFEADVRSHREFENEWLRRRDAPDSPFFGEYVAMAVEHRWKGWQARAALHSTGKPDGEVDHG